MTGEPDTGHEENVVSVGEFQIRLYRQWARKPDACEHKHLEFAEGDVVLCSDCGKQVGAFWALQKLAEDIHCTQKRLHAEREKVAWEASKHIHLKAARRVEEAWRGKMGVECPHCHKQILVEDGLGNGIQINRSYELERRAALKGQK